MRSNMDMENLKKIPQSELYATLEILSNLGITQKHFKCVRSSKKFAKAVALAFLDRDNAIIEYKDVRAILGKDFIPPEEIAIVRKLTYSDEVLRHFAETLPSEGVLQWLRDNGFMLIAGTPNSMSFLEIRNINAQLFFTKSGGWYAEEEQKFSQSDKVTAEWLMMRKGIMLKFMVKTWDEQQKLLTDVEYIPNLAEATWVETTYKEVRNAWLFPDVYVRTSSVDSCGDHVGFGNSSNGGVHIHRGWDGYHHDYLGLAFARKRKLQP